MTTKKKISAAALAAILGAVGYGGYAVIKTTELDALRSGKTADFRVARVIDGDTFELADGDVVRLLGIDAPEEGQCYYDESKAALAQLVEGKDVELRRDVTAADDFGRLLRYAIMRNGDPLKPSLLVDEYMVREGFADVRSNPRDKLYYGLLLEDREKAMKEAKGLWGACDYEPSEWSQKDTPPPSKGCVIKGNIPTSRSGRVYFVPECNNYAQVKVDPDRGERYFCSEKDAIAAGFAKARYCP